MGNQYSSKDNSIKELKELQINQSNHKTGHEISHFSKKDCLEGDHFRATFSSYKGIKTDSTHSLNSIVKNEESTNGITADSESDFSNSEKKNDNGGNAKEVKVSTLFEWKEAEAESVYLTGNFCNWNQTFLMNQINNSYQLNLDLTRGVYQYKFIVDGKWRFSIHHPTCNDGNGNINNTIDTSGYPLSMNLKINGKNNTKKEKFFNGNDALVAKVSSYISEVPGKKELYLDATLCPESYRDLYCIDQNRLKDPCEKDQYLIINSRNYSAVNTSFYSLPPPSHVNSNHLSVKSIENSNQEIIVSSTSQRVRHKFVTVVYYKPVS